MRPSALTVLRAAMLGMVAVVLLVPVKFVGYAIVAQLGLVAASLYLRRRSKSASR